MTISRRRCMQALVFVGVELGLVNVPVAPQPYPRRRKPHPTPTATPTPTALPTATPAPTPTAPPGRPFPAPVTVRTVNVPATIDATGVNDASAGLNAFVNSTSDGSIINFPVNGVFRMDHGLKFGGNATVPRHNLVFEGNGSTLIAHGSASLSADSPFALWNDNTDIVIRNFKIKGNNPVPGMYHPGQETQCGIILFAGQRIEIANCDISNTWADAVETQVTPAGHCPDGVWVHDCTIHDIGRMGISPTSSTGLGVLIEHNDFIRINWVVIDIEPNVDSVECNHITIRNNTFGPQPHINDNSPYIVEAGGLLAAGTVGDITIANNTSVGFGLEIHIPGPGQSFRRHNVLVDGNTSDHAVAGPAMVFAHVDGLTVTNNHQPLSSGSLLSQSDCTAVTIGGNI